MTIRKRYHTFLRIAFAVIIFPLLLNASAQNLFVADYGGFKGIYEITPAGSQSNFVSGLAAPSALAFDKKGDLFVTDMGSGSIIKVTPSGMTNIFASGLSTPYGLAFDNAGDLFEADFGSSRILEFTNQNGVLNTNAGLFASGLDGPVGLAFNRSSNLFEADFKSGIIYEFTNHNGILVSNLNVFVSGLPYPAGLAFNSSNVLFVANDSAIGNILEVMPAGSTNVFASGLNQPQGLAFDNLGNLFEANQGANNIIKITPSGVQSIFFTEPNTNYPSAVAFAPSARLQCVATNKSFRLTVSMSSPYNSTIVQASTNLINWINVATNMPPFTYTDSMAAGARYHFYRTILGP